MSGDPILFVRCSKRGTLTWTPGHLTVSGESEDRVTELVRAIEALLDAEEVDLASGWTVRDALLTVAGACI